MCIMRDMRADEYISTSDAARELGITRQRVLQLIKHDRLKAERFANIYMIRRADLTAVEDRQPGRPRKQAIATSKKKGSKK